MQVDDRAGSGDLAPLLKSRGVRPVDLTRLEYGDVAILGNGPEGQPVNVGIEIKKLPDMIACIQNGRFIGHQLPGMLECYDQIWLLVEGIWRENGGGLIEVPRGQGWNTLRAGPVGFTASALHSFLFTMSCKLNLKVALTGTRRQTVDWLFHINRWWTGKEWDDHKGHLAFDNSAAFTLISRPSLVRRIAKELPGIGWERSGAVARRFGSVLEMAISDRQEWEGIEGIGKVTAKRITEAINGDS